jgi:hypothetical protein
VTRSVGFTGVAEHWGKLVNVLIPVVKVCDPANVTNDPPAVVTAFVTNCVFAILSVLSPFGLVGAVPDVLITNVLTSISSKFPELAFILLRPFIDLVLFE